MTKQKFYTDPPKGGKAKIFDVRSKKDPGKFYKMRIMPDGEIRCSCPWNAIRSGLCSHIKAYLDLDQKARESGNVRKQKNKFASDFPF